MTPWRGLINSSYRRFLPLAAETAAVTLHEGNTPLLHSAYLSQVTGGNVWLKVEGANPTGSFKDRGMTVAITQAAADGAELVICASTGNTSASAAAYAARAGIAAAVLIPESGVAKGKLGQAVRYGARVVEVTGTFDDCLRIARDLAANHPVALVNSVGNELRLSGQRTVAYEIVDTLGAAPDIHCLPVGNGGNITATWQGYRTYAASSARDLSAAAPTFSPAPASSPAPTAASAGAEAASAIAEAASAGAEAASAAPLPQALPRIWGFQAAGAAPFVSGEAVARPQTEASAIRVGRPATWAPALAARDESGGLIGAVTDEEIFEAYGLIARHDGVFAEPASAAGVAGLLKQHRAGAVPPGARIVVTLSGNGLKDPDASLRDGLDTAHTGPTTKEVAVVLLAR
ncbi:threonine synthase [Paractinoplanes atraurantiacus]|uniref:Threonine synthase n=1 Tax=Paractinoplanes atraurantiacus TaxID=1036182 RepID=A0A285K0H0_9ACTN|nr:threonine synthase [Actinoplanes atraurantiacus]SNY66065.1 threonine synthase [Actinoplanes atraurantiacus]